MVTRKIKVNRKNFKDYRIWCEANVPMNGEEKNWRFKFSNEVDYGPIISHIVFEYEEDAIAFKLRFPVAEK